MQILTECHRLSNGLQLLLHPDSEASSISVQLLFQSGSKDETLNQYGFAHLCEHLYFTGTKHVPDIDSLLSLEGCENNAWTDKDQTCFTMSGPPETLELLLWVEQDRWRNIPKGLNRRAFLTERSVVINEFREEYESETYGQAWLKHPSFIYGEDHPYGHPVIGQKETIAQATEERVLAFFRRHYIPNNAILMISGHFCTHQASEYAHKYFSTLPSKNKPSLQPPRRSFKPDTLRVEDTASHSILHLDWILPSKGHPQLRTYQMLTDLLTNPRYGILVQRLELEQRKVVDISSYLNPHRLHSQFTITATANQIPLDALKMTILSELEKILRDGLDPAILLQTRQKISLRWWLGMIDLNTRSEELLDWLAIHGTTNDFKNEIDHWMKLTSKPLLQGIAELIAAPHKEMHCLPSTSTHV